MSLPVLLAFVASVASPSSHWKPDMPTVQALEQLLIMPKRAGPLDSYVRFYAGAVEKGSFVVYGVYLSKAVVESSRTRWPGQGSIRIVNTSDDLPMVYDGECSNISVAWNIDEAAPRVACDGGA